MIKIVINKENDSIVVEGIGYKGNACIKDIDELVKIINAKVTSRKSKPELVQLVGEIGVSK